MVSPPDTAPLPPPPPPDIVIVLVEPVPEATTPAPTKFNVVAKPDKVLLESCIVIPLLIPKLAGVIFFIVPPSSIKTKSASAAEVVVLGAFELDVDIIVPSADGSVNTTFPLNVL